MPRLSRRDFLKLAGLSAASLAFRPYLPPLTEFDDSNLLRVGTTSVSVYREPDDRSAIVATWERDALVAYYDEVESGTPDYNPVWYRVWGGYMHRARMQKVKIRYNTPAAAIEGGRPVLGEITVPFSQSMRYFGAQRGWEPLYRLYYETVHWIVGVEEGPDGEAWYRILDELYDSILSYHVPAAHVRLIPPEEISPLSPDIPFEHKRVEVNLGTQTVSCYEYEQVVFQTRVSTGNPSLLPGANGIPTATPEGRFHVMVKMPSKHMGDGNLASDIEAYELPGVPWCTFFTDKGHAFHGAYWHDNYGVPMSHGCINMRPEEAKWLFRWTLPKAASADIDPLTLDKKGYGTLISIF